MRRLIVPFYLTFTILLVWGCGNASSQPRSGCAVGELATPLGDCILDSTCQEMDDCLLNGRCAWTGEFCVATNAEDCRNSAYCAQKGECQYQENQGLNSGRCVASDSDCRVSDICRTIGKCTAGKKGFCVPGSDADCAQSEACATMKKCKLREVRNADGKKSGIQACQI